jgi:hypothetical protein
MGGNQSGTTTIVQDPWSGVQPYLLDVFGKAQGQFNQGTYGGPYIAPQSPYSQQAITAQAQRAQAGSPLLPAAQGELMKTIQGGYLGIDSNPYLRGAVQEAADAARRNVSGAFGGDNYGGSANREWLARATQNAALPMLSQNYQQERGNQLAAIGAAPAMAAADYGDIGQLALAGSAQETRGQAEIEAAQQKFNAPWMNIQNYNQALMGGQGYGSRTEPYFTNPLASGLGGAAMGFGIGGPWGAAAGGLLGLLSARR